MGVVMLWLCCGRVARERRQGDGAADLAQVEDDEGRIGTEAARGERKRAMCFDLQILKCFAGARRLEKSEY